MIAKADRKWQTLTMGAMSLLLISMMIAPVSSDGGANDDKKTIIPAHEGVIDIFDITGAPHHTTAYNAPRKTLVQIGDQLHHPYPMTAILPRAQDPASSGASPHGGMCILKIRNHEPLSRGLRAGKAPP